MSDPIGSDPEYQPDDPHWITLDQLRALLPIGTARIDQLRRKFGNRWECRAKGVGQPTWIYGLKWIEAFYIDRLATSGRPSGQSPAQKKQHYEAELVEAKCLAFKRNLIEAREVVEMFNEVADEWSKASVIGYKINPEIGEVLQIAADSSRQKIAARFSLSNGHANGKHDAPHTSDGHGGKKPAAGSKKSAPVRRGRNHRPNGPVQGPEV